MPAGAGSGAVVQGGSMPATSQSVVAGQLRSGPVAQVRRVSAATDWRTVRLTRSAKAVCSLPPFV